MNSSEQMNNQTPEWTKRGQSRLLEKKKKSLETFKKTANVKLTILNLKPKPEIIM